MTLLAPTLEAFFTERLMSQKNASPHTIASYRDCLRLLLTFVHDTTGKPPSALHINDLDASTIAAFLDHLEQHRGLCVASRNTRLAAVRSLFRFAALRHPEHSAGIQRVLAIPAKQGDRALVCFLTPDEVDALLASPDRGTRIGRRDHVLLAVAVQTGLRVSELTKLRRSDIHLGTGAHLTCRGKGRRERATPLTRGTVAVHAPTSPNQEADRTTPSSQVPTVMHSDATPCAAWFSGTPAPPSHDVRRWRTRSFHRTSFGTHAP